jgi:formylglycine-generating enzyme required for sulfatase activity
LAAIAALLIGVGLVVYNGLGGGFTAQASPSVRAATATETTLPAAILLSPSPTRPVEAATATTRPTTPPALTPTLDPSRPPTSARPGQAWTRPSDGMVMKYIPSGKFEMGSAEVESHERPVHTVDVSAFWMDEHEVTNAMYAAFLNAVAQDLQVQDLGIVHYQGNPIYDLLCVNPLCATWKHRIALDGEEYKVTPGYADHPVALVSWYGAEAYCAWANARLPTEAEWEKAARGGLAGKMYPWGDETPVCTPGASNGAQMIDCDGDTAPVKQFAPNGFGLYDMAGNVWNWVQDWYGENYYSQPPGVDPQGPKTGQYRVLRGGAWYYDEANQRCAKRFGNESTGAFKTFGFRCASSP